LPELAAPEDGRTPVEVSMRPLATAPGWAGCGLAYGSGRLRKPAILHGLHEVNEFQSIA